MEGLGGISWGGEREGAVGKRRSFGNIAWAKSGYRIRWPIPGTDRRGQETGFPTMELAEARLAQIRLELANERVFGRKARLVPMRIGDYTRVILARMEDQGRKETTIIAYRKAFTAADLIMGDQYMHRVTREDALRWRERLRRGVKGPVSNQTVNDRVAKLAVLYDRGIEDRHANENPFRGLRQLRVKRRAVPWLGYEERLRYLNALRPELRFAAEFLLETGMRQGELFRLRRSDVYLNLDPPMVQVTESKTDEPRWIALTSRAASIVTNRLNEIGPDEPFVWPWRHRDDGFSYLWKLSKKRLIALGLEPLWPHAWRHTCATAHSLGGAPIQEIARILGNTAKTAEKYRDHAADNWERRGAERLDRLRRESETG